MQNIKQNVLFLLQSHIRSTAPSEMEPDDNSAVILYKRTAVKNEPQRSVGYYLSGKRRLKLG